MPGLEHGVKRAAVEFISSLMLVTLLKGVSKATGVYGLAEVFLAVSGLSWVLNAERVKYWSTTYIIGYVMYHAFLLILAPWLWDPFSTLGFAIILVETLVVLARRILKYMDTFLI